MKYVLETKGLCMQYKDFQALSDFNMHVPEGAIYGFVGKNGAGKTTLIRVITGLQFPTAGSYCLYQIPDTDRNIRKERRRMGAVVETPSIYLDMTAEENLKQQYLILGQPDYEGIRELLELVGLNNTGKKKVGDFSLGMRQRLGIVIALAGNPDFLVLDEPINGLDPQGIIEIRELILKLNHEQGITVLISSHILDELSKLATHYGFIDHGHMVKEISAEELEAACAKKIRVRVSDMTAFSKALERQKLDYKIVSDSEADIYSEITVSELVAVGHERSAIYIANLITSIFAGWVFLVIWSVAYLVSGMILMESVNPLPVYLFAFGGMLCELAVFAAIFTGISMVLGKKANSSIACILLTLFILAWGTVIQSTLDQEEFYAPSYNVTEDGEIEYTGELVPNPNYLPGGSTKRAVYELLLDLTPGGQVMQLCAINVDHINQMMLYDLGWFAAVTGAGILMFRRKMLK